MGHSEYLCEIKFQATKKVNAYAVATIVADFDLCRPAVAFEVNLMSSSALI